MIVISKRFGWGKNPVYDAVQRFVTGRREDALHSLTAEFRVCLVCDLQQAIGAKQKRSPFACGNDIGRKCHR
jgi:hypothetical protein